jgi:hypothetical protein
MTKRENYRQWRSLVEGLMTFLFPMKVAKASARLSTNTPRFGWLRSE